MNVGALMRFEPEPVLEGQDVLSVHASSIAFAPGARRIDWRYVRDGAFVGITVFLMMLANLSIVPFYLYPSTERLWLDAHIYFRATEVWLAGGNPWTSTWFGIPFAAPPPALLLNLPLQPFGETAATAFWVVANTLSVLYLIRRLKLSWWWLCFHPIVEGFLGATPDITLAALVLVGWGWLAALTKPYSIPAILSERRYRTVAVGLLLAAITIPFLPWVKFVESRAIVAGAFENYTMTVSAFGQPLLMIGVLVALLSLGSRRGLALTTPALVAQQPHYLVFSLDVIARSRILTWAMAFPVEHLAAFGVVVYALVVRVDLLQRRRRRSSRMQAGQATSIAIATESD